MEKSMVHGGAGAGGILKKRIMKRSKKNSIHIVIDYLISDSYLFAPLISSSPLDSCRGIEIREATKDKRSLVKKIGEYLKSDCYMYASLIGPQSLKGRLGYVKKVCLEVTTTTSITRGDELITESAANRTKEKRVCRADFVDQQNKMGKESVKRTTIYYPNCRSSSISGEGMRRVTQR